MNSNRYAHCFAALFLLIVAVALGRFVLLSRVQYSYMDDEFADWMQQKDYVHTKSDKQEIIFLGDSRMKAGIIPDEICENAYNLAVGGGTTVEMYYSLRDYLKFHAKPKMVVMGFGEFHYQLEDCFFTRNLYFHFTNVFAGVEAQFVKYMESKLLYSELKSGLLEVLKYNLLFPQKYSAACINGKFQREDYNRARYKERIAFKGCWHLGGRYTPPGNPNHIYRRANFIVDKRVDFYMRRIISLCKENDIPLFIEQLPISEPSWKLMTENGYYGQFRDYLRQLSETGVTVEFEVPCYECEYFSDPGHMNFQGGKRFSAEIKAKYGL